LWLSPRARRADIRRLVVAARQKSFFSFPQTFFKGPPLLII